MYAIRSYYAASFVVRDGTIRFREKGYTSGPGLRARLWLASVLD